MGYYFNIPSQVLSQCRLTEAQQSCLLAGLANGQNEESRRKNLREMLSSAVERVEDLELARGGEGEEEEEGGDDWRDDTPLVFLPPPQAELDALRVAIETENYGPIFEFFNRRPSFVSFARKRPPYACLPTDGWMDGCAADVQGVFLAGHNFVLNNLCKTLPIQTTFSPITENIMRFCW